MSRTSRLHSEWEGLTNLLLTHCIYAGKYLTHITVTHPRADLILPDLFGYSIASTRQITGSLPWLHPKDPYCQKLNASFVSHTSLLGKTMVLPSPFERVEALPVGGKRKTRWFGLDR